MRIGDVTLQNAKQFTNMFAIGGGTKSIFELRELFSANYMKYESRFIPTDLRYVKPNWDQLHTKRDKPLMSDEQFEAEMRKIAQDQMEKGKDDSIRKRMKDLIKGYVEVASPDRKAVYDESMKKTGGKMNASGCFYSPAGEMLMAYVPQSFAYATYFTDAENARVDKIYAIYFDEINKIKSQRENTFNQSVTSQSSVDIQV